MEVGVIKIYKQRFPVVSNPRRHGSFRYTNAEDAVQSKLMPFFPVHHPRT